jgi:exodeoxyribonuclease-5
MVTDKLHLSIDQQAAHDAVVEWYKAGKWGSHQTMTLGGYAGTGKTTIMGQVSESIRGITERVRIGFCCYTGKAAQVLYTKLMRANALTANDYCGTIHGMIYELESEEDGELKWRRCAKLDYDFIVVDEASMIDEVLYNDLLSYGVPILAVGDHGQLPPINGQLNLMTDPELRLEKIHRQAEGNPIIKVSMMARLEGRIPIGRHGEWVTKTSDRTVLDRIENPDDAMIICGTNRTRSEINMKVRRRLGFTSPEPMPGEKIICLKNNRELGIFNGMTGKLLEIGPMVVGGYDHLYSIKARMDGVDLPVTTAVNRAQFGAFKTMTKKKEEGAEEIADLVDWGYALTGHKAQGSEARRVVVVEECSWLPTEDLRRRWLYTTVSRAQERLLIIGR